MTEVLTQAAGVSLGGGAVIAVLLVLPHCTRGRYAARWRCWAWLLLALRLAVPLALLPGRVDSAPIQIPVPPDRVLYQPAGAAPQTPVATAAQAPAATSPQRPQLTPPPTAAPVRKAAPGRTVTAGDVLGLLG